MVIRLAATLATCLAVLAPGAQAAEKRLDRSFTVQPGGRLSVNTDGGDIAVSGSDSNSVVVRIVASGPQRMLESMNLAAEQRGNDVEVLARHGSGWLNWFSFGNHEIRITVEVPRNYNIDLRTAGGDLRVARLNGDAAARTSGGDIELADITGPIRVHTSGGDIRLERIDGDTEAETSGGDIDGETLAGDLDLKTSGGEIELRNIEGKLTARTSSGNVTVEDARGEVDLKSSGGDVNAVRVDGRIVAHTSGGDVRAELRGANRGVSLTTSGGDIDLRVPKDIAAVIDASSSGGSVRTELPVTTTEIRERRLRGTINGGGETIYARTSGGSVRLLQAQR